MQSRRCCNQSAQTQEIGAPCPWLDRLMMTRPGSSLLTAKWSRPPGGAGRAARRHGGLSHCGLRHLTLIAVMTYNHVTFNLPGPYAAIRPAAQVLCAQPCRSTAAHSSPRRERGRAGSMRRRVSKAHRGHPVMLNGRRPKKSNTSKRSPAAAAQQVNDHKLDLASVDHASPGGLRPERQLSTKTCHGCYFSKTYQSG